MNQNQERITLTKFLRVSLCTCVALASMLLSPAKAEELVGDWSLNLDSGTPAWLSIKKSDGETVVRMRLHVGPEGPHKNVEESDGRLKFTFGQNKKATSTKTVDVGIKDGKARRSDCDHE